MNLILETYIEDKELFEGVSVALIEHTILLEERILLVEETMENNVKSKIKEVALKQALNLLKLANATDQKERSRKIKEIISKLKSDSSGSNIIAAIRLLFLGISISIAGITAAYVMADKGRGIHAGIVGKMVKDSNVPNLDGTISTSIMKMDTFATKGSFAGAEAFSKNISSWFIKTGSSTSSVISSTTLFAKVSAFMMNNPLVALSIYAAVIALLIVGVIKIYKYAKANALPEKIAAAAASLQHSVRAKLIKMSL